MVRTVRKGKMTLAMIDLCVCCFRYFYCLVWTFCCCSCCGVEPPVPRPFRMEVLLLLLLLLLLLWISFIYLTFSILYFIVINCNYQTISANERGPSWWDCTRVHQQKQPKQVPPRPPPRNNVVL
jgi:hypothetical protein